MWGGHFLGFIKKDSLSQFLYLWHCRINLFISAPSSVAQKKPGVPQVIHTTKVCVHNNKIVCDERHSIFRGGLISSPGAQDKQFHVQTISLLSFLSCWQQEEEKNAFIDFHKTNFLICSHI